MFKWLLSIGMIPVFRRKTQKTPFHRATPQRSGLDFESSYVHILTQNVLVNEFKSPSYAWRIEVVFRYSQETSCRVLINKINPP